MTNPTIQTDIAEVLKDLQLGQKEILKEISDIKVSLETLKGDIKALDTKVEQLDKRICKSRISESRSIYWFASSFIRRSC